MIEKHLLKQKILIFDPLIIYLRGTDNVNKWNVLQLIEEINENVDEADERFDEGEEIEIDWSQNSFI